MDSPEHDAAENARSQPWESWEHRTQLPDDLVRRFALTERDLLFPRNSVEHLLRDHPEDASLLDCLQDLIDGCEWMQAAHGGRLLLYSNFEGIWRRIVIVPALAAGELNVVVSIYRRDRKKTQRAIESGKYQKRGE